MSIVMDRPVTTPVDDASDAVGVTSVDGGGWSHPARCVPPPVRVPADVDAQDGPDGWDLVRAVQTGDKSAFGELYTRHEHTVRQFARGRCGDLDDVVSETFCQALSFISRSDPALWPDVEGRTAPVVAWLVTIARHVIVRRYRDRDARPELPVPDYTTEWFTNTDAIASSDGNPEQVVLRAFDRHAIAYALHQATARLSPAEQQAFRLYDVEGRPVDELARVLGRTRPAVHNLCINARRHLAHRLAPRVEDDTSGVPRYAIAVGRARNAYTRAPRRPAPLLTAWTGQRATQLRTVMGLSGRAFAGYLGVAEQMVSGWTTRPDRVVTADNEVLLDIALARATPAQRAEFDRLLVEQPACPPRGRNQPTPEDQADTTRRLAVQAAQWQAFLHRWHAQHGEQRVTARQLWDCYQGTFPTDRAPIVSVASLGKRLAGHLDRWHGDLVLRVERRTSHSAPQLYWVEQHTGHTTGPAGDRDASRGGAGPETSGAWRATGGRFPRTVRTATRVPRHAASSMVSSVVGVA